MSTQALLMKNPHPSEAELTEALFWQLLPLHQPLSGHSNGDGFYSANERGGMHGCMTR